MCSCSARDSRSKDHHKLFPLEAPGQNRLFNSQFLEIAVCNVMRTPVRHRIELNAMRDFILSAVSGSRAVLLRFAFCARLRRASDQNLSGVERIPLGRFADGGVFSHAVSCPILTPVSGRALAVGSNGGEVGSDDRWRSDAKSWTRSLD